MSGQGADAPQSPLTVREALRQIWLADKYPIRGNEDWREAERLDAEALKNAATAVPSPDDPPEFAQWLGTLLEPKLPSDRREAVYHALHDWFDPPEEIE